MKVWTLGKTRHVAREAGFDLFANNPLGNRMGYGKYLLVRDGNIAKQFNNLAEVQVHLSSCARTLWDRIEKFLSPEEMTVFRMHLKLCELPFRSAPGLSLRAIAEMNVAADRRYEEMIEADKQAA